MKLRSALILLIVLAIVGALAYGAVRYFRSVHAVELPIGADLSIHWPALVFAVLLCAVTTVITGVIPAWRCADVDLASGLKAASRGATYSGLARRASQLLIVAEMTASVVLPNSAETDVN